MPRKIALSCLMPRHFGRRVFKNCCSCATAARVLFCTRAQSAPMTVLNFLIQLEVVGCLPKCIVVGVLGRRVRHVSRRSGAGFLGNALHRRYWIISIYEHWETNQLMVLSLDWDKECYSASSWCGNWEVAEGKLSGEWVVDLKEALKCFSSSQ